MDTETLNTQPLWTSAEAVAATGGKTQGAWAVHGVSIDTRTLRAGDLFVALKDLRDGHDFVAQALASGAGAALVSRVPEGVAPDAPLLVVPDVLRALEDLGRAARARSSAKVVGVTGSVGKTSTKEMLRRVLGGQGCVHAAEASYNNHWGVPLTLARLPQSADFAVIEIGMNHPGEIAPLARMADLDVAIITIVAPAHLEAFASVDEIAQEKAAILDGLRQGGTAVLPRDIPTSAVLFTAAAARPDLQVLSFGTSDASDYQLTDVHLTQDATIVHANRPAGVHANRPAGAFLFKVRSPGRHFASNGLAALAVADALGLDPMIAANDLGTWAPPPGRGTRERVLLDLVDETAFDLIDDAFNANPASMSAALDVLIAAQPEDGTGRIGKGRRIAILGDMLELGSSEGALHLALADHPGLAAIDIIHCVGPRMKALHAALPRSQRGEWSETAAPLAARARSLIDAGDIVLAKGSKGIKVSQVVDALRKLGQPAAPHQGEA